MIVVTCDTCTNIDGTPYEFAQSSRAVAERSIARIENARSCRGVHTVEEFDENASLANMLRAQRAR